MADLTSRESGKQRAGRIRLDHYRETDALGRARNLLLVAAAIASAAAVAYFSSSPAGRVAFSHGPISQSHAAWESRCDACHAPDVALRPDAVLASAVPADAGGRCLVCHAVSSHRSMPQDPDPACSACHREHRGVEVDLTRVADASCTACHASPEEIAEDRGARLVSVSAFPGGHPPFASLPDDLETGDPGRLGFSHSRHMRLGLASSADGGASETLRYEDLAEADRDAYLRPGDGLSDPVQLECASCHELERDASAPGVRLQAAGAGVYLPVSYEQHCAACHPLKTPSADSGSAGSSDFPHGVEGDAAVEHLTRQYRDEWFTAPDDNLRRELQTPTPGRSRLLRQRVDSAVATIDNRVDQAVSALRDRCSECHELTGAGLDVAPTQVTGRWFQKASFGHAAHAAMSCRECHEGAYADDVGLSLADRKLESRRVLIPGMDNCVQCHAPKTASLGGIRHDCGLCHRYHEGTAGGVAHAGPPLGELTTADLLRGVADAANRD